jgi:hypothetical protein
MILATRSSAKTFRWLRKRVGASIPTRSTESGRAKFRKKEWHRDDGKRFVVRASELLTAVLELEWAARRGKSDEY